MLRLMPGRRKLTLRHTVDGIAAKIRSRAPLDELLAALDAAREPVRRFLRGHMADGAATALALKLLNLLLARYHYELRDTRLVSLPLGLLVDPSNGCNLACPGCVQSARAKSLRLFDWQSGLLPAERFAAMLARYGPAAMQVMFCNYGEPLTNPDTPRLIEMARGFYSQTALSTNLAVGRFDADAYVRSGLDFMFLAIDGATPEVYRRYRKNGDLDIVYRNVEKLVEARRRLGIRTPVLRWQYLAFEHNAQEVPRALARARELGVDQFALEIPFDVSWDDPEIRAARDVQPFRTEFVPDVAAVLRENWKRPVPPATAEAMERELERGWSGRAAEPDSVAPGGSPHTCRWLYKSLTLDANGRILPCCGAPKPGVDVVFGSLTERSSDEFNSDRFLQARRFFRDPSAYQAAQVSGSPSVYCAHCEWDQDHTEFGPGEVAQYLRTAAGDAIDAATIEACSAW